MPDSLHIDTQSLGHATHVNTEPKYWLAVRADLIQVVFDTGVVMFVPSALFHTMKFSLMEKDPDPPSPNP